MLASLQAYEQLDAACKGQPGVVANHPALLYLYAILPPSNITSTQHYLYATFNLQGCVETVPNRTVL